MITEEQARALLAQEKMETEQRLGSADKHKRKIVALVVGAAVFLVVVGLAVWLMAKARIGAN